MNLFTKQTYRHRKETTGYQRGKDGRVINEELVLNR